MQFTYKLEDIFVLQDSCIKGNLLIKYHLLLFILQLQNVSKAEKRKGIMDALTGHKCRYLFQSLLFFHY